MQKIMGVHVMATACYRHPDCVRRFIDTGADVKYAYPGDNAIIIYMTSYCFSKDADEGDLDFEEGSVINTVELLLEAGVPANSPQIDHKTGLTKTDEDCTLSATRHATIRRQSMTRA